MIIRLDILTFDETNIKMSRPPPIDPQKQREGPDGAFPLPRTEILPPVFSGQGRTAGMSGAD